MIAARETCRCRARRSSDPRDSHRAQDRPSPVEAIWPQDAVRFGKAGWPASAVREIGWKRSDNEHPNAHRETAIIIGLVSDTHGLIRDGLFRALAGVSQILHAGDVGGREVLDALGAIAPVQAVYGNVDPLDGVLPDEIVTEVGGLSIHVSHGHEVGSPTPAKLLSPIPADIIVFGHTHDALVERTGTRLVVNPGAAGPRRFDMSRLLAILLIVNGGGREVAKPIVAIRVTGGSAIHRRRHPTPRLLSHRIQSSPGKLISHPVDGEDVLWVARIGFDLLAQPRDVDVDGARRWHGVVAPHLVQAAPRGSAWRPRCSMKYLSSWNSRAESSSGSPSFVTSARRKSTRTSSNW